LTDRKEGESIKGLTIASVQGVNDQVRKTIGTTFEALNHQAYRSKAGAAPRLEKHPSPRLLEFVIRKKKTKPSREGKATVGATGPAIAQEPNTWSQRATCLEQSGWKVSPDLLRSIYWKSKPLFKSINLSGSLAYY
jgi:hypothetical protein